MFKTQAHAMAPFQGAGAGQAIEVSSRIFSRLVRKRTLIKQTFDLGRFDPGFVALKRARNEDHSASGT
jgi:hypothetical protein